MSVKDDRRDGEESKGESRVDGRIVIVLWVVYRTSGGRLGVAEAQESSRRRSSGEGEVAIVETMKRKVGFKFSFK